MSAPVVESCYALDSFRWYREGLTRPGLYFVWAWKRDGEEVASIGVSTLAGAVELAYTAGGRHIREVVQFSQVPNYFGGTKPVFRCPGCAGTYRKLYLRGGYFRCRRCHGLKYRSQYEDAKTRLVRKAQKIRVRLGGHPGLIYPFPGKPKKLRWETYHRLEAQVQALEAAYLASLTSWVERQVEWLDKVRPILRRFEGNMVVPMPKKKPKLTEAQLKAIPLLVEGRPDEEVAAAVGVDPATVRLWRITDPEFIAELNRARKEEWQDAIDRLRALVPKAINALEEEFARKDSKNRWRAALELLKLVGLGHEAEWDYGQSIGPTDPRKVAERLKAQD